MQIKKEINVDDDDDNNNNNNNNNNIVQNQISYVERYLVSQRNHYATGCKN
jgi:hypothetical protein